MDELLSYSEAFGFIIVGIFLIGKALFPTKAANRFECDTSERSLSKSEDGKKKRKNSSSISSSKD